MTRQPWWRGSRGEWYVVAQFVLLGLVFVAPWWPWRSPAWPGPWATAGRVLGSLLALAAAAFVAVGVINLGRNLTALPFPRDGSRMVATGVYGVVRHPIYSGLIMGSLGWGLLLHAPLSLGWAIALFILLDVKSRREEAWLRQRFPDYEVYQARVRKLIPWIY